MDIELERRIVGYVPTTLHTLSKAWRKAMPILVERNEEDERRMETGYRL